MDYLQDIVKPLLLIVFGGYVRYSYEKYRKTKDLKRVTLQAKLENIYSPIYLHLLLLKGLIEKQLNLFRRMIKAKNAINKDENYRNNFLNEYEKNNQNIEENIKDSIEQIEKNYHLLDVEDENLVQLYLSQIKYAHARAIVANPNDTDFNIILNNVGLDDLIERIDRKRCDMKSSIAQFIK